MRKKIKWDFLFSSINQSSSIQYCISTVVEYFWRTFSSALKNVETHERRSFLPASMYYIHDLPMWCAWLVSRRRATRLKKNRIKKHCGYFWRSFNRFFVLKYKEIFFSFFYIIFCFITYSTLKFRRRHSPQTRSKRP